jgi:hypothetical protein
MSATHQTRRTIRQAKRSLSRRLLPQPGVAGVGIEAAPEGGERIKVYLAVDDPVLTAQVPAEVAGYPVVVEVIAAIVPRRAGT